MPFYSGFIVDLFTIKRMGLPAQNYFHYDPVRREVYRTGFRLSGLAGSRRAWGGHSLTLTTTFITPTAALAL